MAPPFLQEALREDAELGHAVSSGVPVQFLTWRWRRGSFCEDMDEETQTYSTKIWIYIYIDSHPKKYRKVNLHCFKGDLLFYDQSKLFWVNYVVTSRRDRTECWGFGEKKLAVNFRLVKCYNLPVYIYIYIDVDVYVWIKQINVGIWIGTCSYMYLYI